MKTPHSFSLFIYSARLTKLILWLGVLSCSFYAKAQKDTLRPKWFYNLSVGNSVSRIINESVDNDKYLDTRSQRELRIGNIFGKTIGGNFYFIFGLCYEQFSSYSVSKGWYKGSLSIDRDYYYYYPVYITDYTLTRRIGVLELPLGLRAMPFPANHVRFLIDFGIQPTIPISSSVKYKGSYSYEGLYPTTQGPNVFVLIKDDSYYGYSDGISMNKESEYPTRMVLNFFADMGFIADVSKTTSLTFAVSYNKSLGDLVKSTAMDAEYVNVENKSTGYTKTKVVSIGVNIGIQFLLK